MMKVTDEEIAAVEAHEAMAERAGGKRIGDLEDGTGMLCSLPFAVFEELERLRGIVRDLADSAPVVTEYDGVTGRNYCSLCISDGGRPDVHHVAGCPWKRAVEEQAK